MPRTIKAMEEAYLLPALDFLQEVFSDWADENEGTLVKRLVQEIRAKDYYVPELELITVDARGDIIAYGMFSRFPLAGRYADQLLLLSPVAVKTSLQRQHLSKALLEYGFAKAKAMGYQAVLVEGDPKNYQARGFLPSNRYGIEAATTLALPSPEYLMVKELVPGALDHIKGVVDFSFYETLRTE